MGEPAEALEFAFDGPLDLRQTLAPLAAGRFDPTQRFGASDVVRASRTPEGPATLWLRRTGERRLAARAWGPGAAWMLAGARDLVGLDARAVPLPEGPPALRQLARRCEGMRLPRTQRVLEALVVVVLQQLVSWREANRAFANLVRTLSEPAPGPAPGLMLPVAAERLRDLAPALWPPLGILAKQGRTLREIGLRASRIEAVDGLPAAESEHHLCAIRGIGPWSANSVMLRALDQADAVPVGDLHLPTAVATLLGDDDSRTDAPADDAQMLRLLEPYRPYRGLVIRWIHAAAKTPERRHPRRPLRPLPPGARSALRRYGPR